VHPYHALLAPEDSDRFARLIDDMRHQRAVERRHHFDLVRGDGSRFEAEITCFDPSYRSSAGLVVRDRAEMAHRARMDLLGELVGGVVHDINTPLGTLKSGTELMHTLAKRIATGDGLRASAALDGVADDMRAAVERIEALTHSLGAYARLEGAALRELAPQFGTGVAHAICERTAAESRDR
jgi:signal transduction histidine kinase